MEKTKKSFSIVTVVIIALVVAALSSAATFLVAKNFIFKDGKSNNVKGTWYNTYAGRTFALSLKTDNSFEYGYEGEEMTKGTFKNSNDVITLTSDAGVDKLVYDLGKGFIEINSTKYYKNKNEATKNDGFYYIPEDYDTSMFKTIKASEMIEKFNKGEEVFVLTARGSCGYCQQFRPVAAASVEKYNYTLYYLNTAELTEEDYTNIRNLHSKFAEFGSTPNVYHFKNKDVVDIQEGAADAETYGAFLVKNGVKEK